MSNSRKPYPKYAGGDYPDGLVDQSGRSLTYKYFVRKNRYPVRFQVQEDGSKIRAETIGFPSGQIETAHILVGLFKDSDGCDFIEVSKEEFYEACDVYIAGWSEEQIAKMEKTITKYENKRGFFDDLIKLCERILKERREARKNI